MNKINIPLSVPRSKRKDYERNYLRATRETGRLMMFAGDQKVEHLNNNFIGKNIPSEVANPEHYFKIASEAQIGVFATQLGLVSRYAEDYQDIPYIIKMNSKSNIVKTDYKDPISECWYSVDDVVEFKKQSGLDILGVGYTVYLGSWYEPQMLSQAAQLIYEAHQQGLIAIIWMYPRGKMVKKEKDTHLIAGGAGVALCLDADFVKVNYPDGKDSKKIARQFREVTDAAGRTGVVCAGGAKKDSKIFLKNLYDQIQIGKIRGTAIGRNIYQQDLEKAVRMANAISSVVLYNYSPEKAYKVYTGNKKLDC